MAWPEGEEVGQRGRVPFRGRRCSCPLEAHSLPAFDKIEGKYSGKCRRTSPEKPRNANSGFCLFLPIECLSERYEMEELDWAFGKTVGRGIEAALAGSQQRGDCQAINSSAFLPHRGLRNYPFALLLRRIVVVSSSSHLRRRTPVSHGISFEM